jgi:hypothetical protein
MRRFPAAGLAFCAAISVALPTAAHGEVDPDTWFGDFRHSPWSYGFAGPSGVRPQAYFDYQPQDCNKAGATGLRPVFPGVDYYDTPWGGVYKGGRLGVYDKGLYELGDHLPGQGTGQANELQNYGADQGPTVAPEGEYGNLEQAIRDMFGGPPAQSGTTRESPVGRSGDSPGRESMVGLRGGLGTLELGRLETPYKYSGGVKYDPFVATSLEARGAGVLSLGPSNASGETNHAIDEDVWYLRDSYADSVFNSFAVETPIGGFPESLSGAIDSQVTIGDTQYTSMLFPEQYTGDVYLDLQNARINFVYRNGCWEVKLPSDPNFKRTSRHGGNSWGADVDDQWAIKRVGFTDDETSAWNLVPESAAPVIVAVIDTGLDWHHLDIDPVSIWRNADEIPANGIDDDRNGYVDDVIGWDFIARNNRPWDFDGHGTLITGIIAAAHNDVGIAGINPNARIMMLKGVNNFGTTRPSYIAEAIVYAVDNGARVVNISVGGDHANRMVRAAVDYANEKGVLIVAAAGNESQELIDYGPGGNENVLTVGATWFDDRAADFSNYGDTVDVVAPGVDVLSLRARHTDANYRPGQEGNETYAIGDNFVGEDKRYFHASGTSFSAPIVTGLASLLLSKNPDLTGSEVRHIIEQTASDVDLMGRDKYTGHGMVDARAALSASPGQFITAEISRIEMLPAEAPSYIQVHGTIDASDFKRAWVQIGPGENPGAWRFVGQKRKLPIRDGRIASFSLSNFTQSGKWLIVVNVEDANGVIKRASFPVEIR